MSRVAIHALARRPGSLDLRAFRNACTLFATGVTVAAVRAPDESLHGLTVSSFTPVSVEPPLILICIDHGFTFLQHFRACTHFAVNILAESQREIAVSFAEKEDNRFEGVDSYLTAGGVPFLRGSLAAFECRLEAIVEAGDHAIFLAEVVHAESRGGNPLLYFQRDYRSMTRSPDHR
jgi:flavin reductase (DIM6/NTAB) family NADH-FMN oxidoreductase RutF